MSAVAPPGALRLLQVSDVHFGAPAVLAQVAAVESLVAREAYDAVVVSGDVSQRARIGECQAARRWLDVLERSAPVLVVPGNHDTAWWEAPLGLGDVTRLHRTYRRWVSDTLEPELRVVARTAAPDGTRVAATLVGVLSAQGIRLATLTTNPRHLSVIGLVRPAQWTRVHERFAAAPTDDARIVVLHHNLRRGRLSNRWGLRHGEASLRAFAATGADLALCGHDHEEQIAALTPAESGLTDGGPVVSCAGTISNRSRGHRASSVTEIVIDATALALTVRTWDGATFAPGEPVRLPRRRHG